MSNLIERFVAGREVSGLPLSIATSLAIESACGVHPEIPVKAAPALDFQRFRQRFVRRSVFSIRAIHTGNPHGPEHGVYDCPNR
jgi:hypothetical protein